MSLNMKACWSYSVSCGLKVPLHCESFLYDALSGFLTWTDVKKLKWYPYRTSHSCHYDCRFNLQLFLWKKFFICSIFCMIFVPSSMQRTDTIKCRPFLLSSMHNRMLRQIRGGHFLYSSMQRTDTNQMFRQSRVGHFLHSSMHYQMFCQIRVGQGHFQHSSMHYQMFRQIRVGSFLHSSMQRTDTIKCSVKFE